MRFRRQTLWPTVVFGAVMLAWVLAPACSKSPDAGGEESPDHPEEAVPEVTLTRVERADISAKLAVTGTLAALPNQDVKVSSLVPGRIARMMVAEGDRVKAGRVMAKVDDRPFLDLIQQAEGAVAQAKANLENARLNLRRNEGLFERGIAARKDLEGSRTEVAVDEAALRQAEAALALARLQLARTEVLSPLDGIVVKRLVSVGEQVDGTAAQPVFEVASLGEVELFGNVPASYLPKIHEGTALTASADAFPDKNFPARVVAISPAVDSATNVGVVRIRIANGAGLLRLGMFLTAQLPIETHLKALVVPPPAVYRDEQNQPQVYRVNGDSAEAVAVKLGLESPTQVELLSGVKEGDTVILTGGYGLAARAKIKVKP